MAGGVAASASDAQQPLEQLFEQQQPDVLNLAVVGPKGGQQSSLTASTSVLGKELKQLIQDALGLAQESQLLFFQNGSRNAAKTVIDDMRTLAEQGVGDNATVTVRVNEAHVPAEDSALRQSIAKNGVSSYYYAHANERALPVEHRYAYGGAPAKLDELAPDAAVVALQQAQAISRYSWADEGEFVCIYVSAEGEADAIAAAGDGKDGQVQVQFDVKAVELRIGAAPRQFALVVRNLEHEIVASESKHRLSAGKRVTLKLKKRREGTWVRLVKPQ